MVCVLTCKAKLSPKSMQGPHTSRIGGSSKLRKTAPTILQDAHESQFPDMKIGVPLVVLNEVAVRGLSMKLQCGVCQCPLQIVLFFKFVL